MSRNQQLASGLIAFAVLSAFIGFYVLIETATNSLPVVVSNTIAAALTGLYLLVMAFVFYDIK